MPDGRLNVTACRELIAHLKAQPPERFHMGSTMMREHTCGTACCIAGHGALLWFGDDSWSSLAHVEQRLGLQDPQLGHLVCPSGWSGDDVEVWARFPLSRAIATLERLVSHYEATGEVVVDWGPEPGDEPKQPWSAPVVSARNLPDCLTIALDAPAPSLVRETAR